jgi:DNA-binding CsgD family transcriptional regulator/tetratricopeptide (TPR) repeat protein
MAEAAAPERPLVGRRDELRQLTSVVSDHVRGAPVRPSMLLITGEAGVGKSHLAEAFAESVRAAGWRTLLGRCLDLGSSNVAHGPLVEALAQARPRQTVRAGQRSALLTDLLDELYEISSVQPVLLVIEDVHWADQSTLDLLLRLAMLPMRDVLIAATMRSDEPRVRPRLGPFIAELARARAVLRIDLEPFDRAGTRELVKAVLGKEPTDDMVATILDRSGGNAYIAEELAEAAGHGEPVPRSLSETLLARTDRISPTGRHLLELIAVAGRPVSDAELAAASSTDSAGRLAALREAVTCGVLVAEPATGKYGFRHALLREALYDDILPGERARVHHALAQALEALSDTPVLRERSAGERAHHWRRAGQRNAALTAAIEAASAAETSHGFAAALSHYDDVLELWDETVDPETVVRLTHQQVMVRAAAAANLSGAHRRAAALITGALDAGSFDADETAALHERRGRYLWASGDSRHALADYGRAVELSTSGSASPTHAKAVAAHAQAMMLLSRFTEAITEALHAVELAAESGSRSIEGHARNTRGYARAQLGELEDGLADLSAAEQIARAAHDLDDTYRAILNRTEILVGPANRPADAAEVASAGAAAADADGLRSDYGVSLRAGLATALFGLGRWEQAAAVLTDAFNAAPDEIAAIDAHLAGATLAVASGAATHLEALDSLVGDTLEVQCRAPTAALAAELALWDGRTADAETQILDGLRTCAGTQDSWFTAWLVWLGEWAVTEMAGSGSAPDQLRAALRDASATLSTRWLAPSARAHILAARAEAVSNRPGGVEAASWSAAVRAADASGDLYRGACIRWRHGEVLARSRGRRSDAAAELRTAARTAEALGARPLQRRASAALARLGLQSTVSSADHLTRLPEQTLTPRELDVLGLISAGRTNREIAGELFIAAKTAELHVSRVLRKLDARNRVEAVSAARRQGLLP